MSIPRLVLLAILSLMSFVVLSAAATAQGSVELETDRRGRDYRGFTQAAPDIYACQAACAADPVCRAWTLVRPGLQGPAARCWLKFGIPQAARDTCCTSGVVRRAPSILDPGPAANGRRIEVLPILFVPADNATVTEDVVDRYSDLVYAHLVLAQRFYKDMLETDTFRIAGTRLAVFRSRNPDSFYTSRLRVQAGQPDAAHVMLREIFEWRRDNREVSPYVYLVIYARSIAYRAGDPFFGGGRTFNGRPGSGGGIVDLELSSLLEDRPYRFQAALVHELGHGFGLVHVDCFGYDQRNSASVMSYDSRWDTRGLAPSPGRFSAEDLFLLAQNTRVFPNFRFIESRHDPQRTRRVRPACHLGAMTSYVGPRANAPRCSTYPCP